MSDEPRHGKRQQTNVIKMKSTVCARAKLTKGQFYSEVFAIVCDGDNRFKINETPMHAESKREIRKCKKKNINGNNGNYKLLVKMWIIANE